MEQTVKYFLVPFVPGGVSVLTEVLQVVHVVYIFLNTFSTFLDLRESGYSH